MGGDRGLRAQPRRAERPVTAQVQADLPRQLHVERVDPGQQPALQQPAGRRPGAVGRAVGEVTDRPLPGQPLQHGELVGLELGERPGQVGRQLDAQFGGAAAQPGRVPHGAPDRVGGAEQLVAPQQRPGREPLDARRHDVGGHVGQRGGQAADGDAVGLGEQHDVEHLQGRGVQLVEGAVDRHRHREPAGQGDDVRGRGAGDVGPGHQQRAQLLVAAGAQPGGERRRGVRGHPVHATSSPQGDC